MVYSAPQSSNNAGGTSTDIALPLDFEDSISDLAWSPTANHLAVASWDHKVRVYDIKKDASATGVAAFSLDHAALSCHWSKDGMKLVAAGTDKTARVVDFASGSQTPQQVALHDAPIRAVRFIETRATHGLLVATASWDSTLKYWDMRQPTPIATVSFDSKIYTMDARDDMVVLGTADSRIHLIDLKNPTVVHRKIEPLFTNQVRSVRCYPDAGGFYLAGTEGRAAWQWLDPKKSYLNAKFKCHRDSPVGNVTNVYPVNAIAGHPVQRDVFATAGGDGKFHFWSKDMKTRVCAFEKFAPAANIPAGLIPAITAAEFNTGGDLFAYAYSYDWSKGYQGNSMQYPTKVMLHQVNPAELKPRRV